MAWIESHQELGRHPKTKKFARRMGITLPAAVGHLHYFWWWAMDYAQDGDLTRYEAADIADACEWDGEPDKLLEALIHAGFVNKDLNIHDWFEYAGRLIEKKVQNKERKRKSRAKKKEVTSTDDDGHADVTRTSQGQDDDVCDGHRATKPNLTKPNLNNKEEEKEEDAIQKVYRFYQSNFGMISPYYSEHIEKWIKDMNADVVMLAMQQALDNNVKKWTYINKTLNDWHEQGARTIEQCLALVAEFEARKGATASEKPEGKHEGVRSGRAKKTSGSSESEFAFLDRPGRS